MSVATKTTTVRGEDGKPERLIAGVSFVHDQRHWLLKTYPDLFAPDTQAHRYNGTRSAARTSAPPRPLLILDESATPTVAVRLRGKARGLIRDEAFRSRDGQEIGGALYGVPARGDTVTVCRASGPGARSTRSKHKFEIDPRAFEAGENGPVRWLGDWHTHPEGHGIPSDGDLKGWARTLEAYGNGTDRYLGLIVTAPLRQLDWGDVARHDWNKPIVHGWVLTRLPDRLVCEPANVEGW